MASSDTLTEIRPKKILIAQQDPQERTFIRLFLELVGGYEVIEAPHGVGLIKALKNRPDLILMDTVAQGNFIRALEIIRRNRVLGQIPIAVYSHEQQKLAECVKKGADGFVIKPTPPAILLGKLWKLLGEESQKEATAAGFASKYKRDITKIDNLPTLPTVYTEVEGLCKNPDVSADELSKVIETDPSISLKLLNLANSAFFGFSRQIKSVRDAISLLGNQTVQNSVLNIAIFEATKDLKNSAGLDKNAFWLHSAAVGACARVLTEKLNLDRPESFTAGIIHDMGKIILDALYTDFFAEAIARVQSSDLTLYQAEEETIGLNHCQIGRELCENWNLPVELIEAVSYHHRPSSAEKDSQMASLIHLGDILSRKFGVGSGGDSQVPEPMPGAFKRLQITEEQLEALEPEMQEAIDRDKAILSILQK